MLSRFKMTYQLSEVCGFKDIQQWLAAVGDFTAQGFLSWKVRINTPYQCHHGMRDRRETGAYKANVTLAFSVVTQ